MMNVCINGLFRYDQYIRQFAERGCLNRFYFSHRLSTNAAHLGIGPDQSVNLWFKEYGLNGLARLGLHATTDAQLILYDLWQSAVISRWKDAETVLAVIGATADHIMAHAQRRGSTTIGHAVNSHPAEFLKQIAIEHDLLGIAPPEYPGMSRRLSEMDLCDHILADSSFTARSFVERGTPPDRVSVISPGVDAARFAPRNSVDRDTDTFTVVTVGAVVPRKGHRYLLEAFRHLDPKSSRLIVVGALSEHSRQLLARHEGEFTHINRIANWELRGLLVKASVFVLPSVEDGFAQAAIEALACGVPVICSANAGVADLIVDGVNGWVVAARDPEAIAERLVRLKQDPELAEKMGVSAARMIATSGGWGAYVDQFVGRFIDGGRRATGFA